MKLTYPHTSRRVWQTPTNESSKDKKQLLKDTKTTKELITEHKASVKSDISEKTGFRMPNYDAVAAFDDFLVQTI